MTDGEMQLCILKARHIAVAAGPMHAFWDIISDAEAILAGKPSVLSREMIEKAFSEMQRDPPPLGWGPDTLVNRFGASQEEIERRHRKAFTIHRRRPAND
jgi:hypothetical protein